jgi:hypothetical protein
MRTFKPSGVAIFRQTLRYPPIVPVSVPNAALAVAIRLISNGRNLLCAGSKGPLVRRVRIVHIAIVTRGHGRKRVPGFAHHQCAVSKPKLRIGDALAIEVPSELLSAKPFNEELARFSPCPSFARTFTGASQSRSFRGGAQWVVSGRPRQAAASLVFAHPGAAKRTARLRPEAGIGGNRTASSRPCALGCRPARIMLEKLCQFAGTFVAQIAIFASMKSMT